MKTKIRIFLLTMLIPCFGTLNTVIAQNSVLAIVKSKDTMGVFYFGIGTLEAIGVANEKINATINNETITGNNGKYIVKIATKAKTTSEVSVDDKKIDKKEFDIKIPKSELEKIGNVFCGVVDLPSGFNFTFEIESFDLSCKSTQGFYKHDMKYYNISDATKAMKAVFKICKPGEKIYITNIQVKTPNGLRKIPSINIIVK